MPQSLAKVTKHIRRKKGRVTGLHENSRDAKKLRKAGSREERVGKMSAVKARSEEAYGPPIFPASPQLHAILTPEKSIASPSSKPPFLTLSPATPSSILSPLPHILPQPMVIAQTPWPQSPCSMSPNCNHSFKRTLRNRPPRIPLLSLSDRGLNCPSRRRFPGEYRLRA